MFTWLSGLFGCGCQGGVVAALERPVSSSSGLMAQRNERARAEAAGMLAAREGLELTSGPEPITVATTPEVDNDQRLADAVIRAQNAWVTALHDAKKAGLQLSRSKETGAVYEIRRDNSRVFYRLDNYAKALRLAGF